MSVKIRQCRYCTQDKKSCPVKKDLQGIGGAEYTLTHNCQRYKKCFSKGDVVEVELKEMIVEEECGYTDYDGKWASLGMVRGTIVGFSGPSFSVGDCFIIELEEKVKLLLPETGQSWATTKEREVEFVKRRANKIKLLGDKNA